MPPPATAGCTHHAMKERKKFSPLCPLSCRLGHRQISAHKAFILLWEPTTVASCQSQGFIPQVTSQSFSFTNPRHSLLSHHSPCLPDIRTSFLFKQSFTVSIMPNLLSDYLHTPLHTPCSQSYHSPFSTLLNHWKTPSIVSSLQVAPLSCIQDFIYPPNN